MSSQGISHNARDDFPPNLKGLFTYPEESQWFSQLYFSILKITHMSCRVIQAFYYS